MGKKLNNKFVIGSYEISTIVKKIGEASLVRDRPKSEPLDQKSYQSG